MRKDRGIKLYRLKKASHNCRGMGKAKDKSYRVRIRNELKKSE